MKKVIKLTESQLRKIVEQVLSQQKRNGDDPEVLQAIADMNFTKEACPRKSNEGISLSFEYCNKTYPNIEISYTTAGLELLDLKKQKIIKTWDGFTADDIPELERYVKMSTI